MALVLGEEWQKEVVKLAQMAALRDLYDELVLAKEPFLARVAQQEFLLVAGQLVAEWQPDAATPVAEAAYWEKRQEFSARAKARAQSDAE